MPSDSTEFLMRSGHPPPPLIAGYRICARLGHGGMGVVYAARPERRGSMVAIKLLRADAATPETLARFDRERRILARLDHPDIARRLDAGETTDGTPYLVMEYVEGQSLLDHCNTRGLDTRARLHLFHRVSRAVAAAHELGIVHRDLKPANILVTADGQPKLVDFGIAKLTTRTGASLTGTDCRWLTPEYASIEQLRGRAPTPASDVYSLGVILRELCDQRDSRLDRIIRQATMEHPDSRYRSAGALADEVAAYLDGRPLKARPAVGHRRQAALILAIFVLGACFALRPSPPVRAFPTAGQRDYLIARHMWNKLSVRDLSKAETGFRRSIATEPRSALAHAGLADALYFLGELGGLPPMAAFEEAKLEAVRAVQLDDQLAIAHAVLGSVLLAADLSWAQAEGEFKQALRLDPQCVRALQGYGCLLMRAGRFSEARQMIGQARALEPASPILGVLEARISYYGREYARARDELRIVLDREPGFPLAHFYLALSNSYLGDHQEAEAEMKQSGLSGDALAVEIAWLRAREGHREAGLRLLDGGMKGAEALMLAGELGRVDEAVAVLEDAFQKKWPIVLAIRSDPRFDSLRGDPRFSALLRRAGFTN